MGCDPPPTGLFKKYIVVLSSPTFFLKLLKVPPPQQQQQQQQPRRSLYDLTALRPQEKRRLAGLREKGGIPGAQKLCGLLEVVEEKQ